MTVTTTPFDAADYLDSPEMIADFLSDAFESGHAGVIANALSAVARARGVAELVGRTGLSLALDGHPDFATVLKVLAAAGVTLKATVAA